MTAARHTRPRRRHGPGRPAGSERSVLQQEIQGLGELVEVLEGEAAARLEDVMGRDADSAWTRTGVLASQDSMRTIENDSLTEG